MSEHSANNSRIAKNAAMIYVRMFFTMAVSLYTSRVVLQTLGVADYGTYNVVGGFVSLFSIISGSLSSSISRYITFELGRGEADRLSRVFSTGMNIQMCLSALILVVAETVGLWFVNTQMNLPAGRVEAANWVFQCSVATSILGLLGLPYDAAIVAHEKMGVFALLSIGRSALNLAAALSLPHIAGDSLTTYAALMLAIAALFRIVYGVYGRRHFAECRYRAVRDMKLLREMGGFAGWNFLGNGAFLLNTQGVNMLMNIYFDVTVNAARAVASQVDSAVKQFVTSFTTAVNPQITKSYAQGDLPYMHSLVCRSSKFSAFLVLFAAAPILVEADTILRLWLGEVPQYAAEFTRWVIMATFVDGVLANSLVTSMFATGRIRRYQVVVSLVGGAVFPLTWAVFSLGAEPWWGYAVYFGVYSVLLFVRLRLLRGMIGMPVMRYVRDVLRRVVPVFALSVGGAWAVALCMPAGVARLAAVCAAGAAVTAVAAYALGLTKGERAFVRTKALELVKRKR